MKSSFNKILILFCLTFTFGNAQNNIKRLNNVPKKFIQNYFQQKHDYNPLHVGDKWQYYFKEDGVETGEYVDTRIVKDSIINGKRYFKKINWLYDFNPNQSNFVSWERNDSLADNSYMLDFEDANNNGDTLEDLPLDSLDLPNHAYYTSYKYSYRGWLDGYFGKKDVIIYDSSWYNVWGDTVLVRIVEYSQLFLIEAIADKYGTIWFSAESPARYLTGAIINGKQYGNIVSIKKEEKLQPDEFKLENNYPNPFNPSTNIHYEIPNDGLVTLKVYDELGREVKTLVNQYLSKGRYDINFNADNLASGIYFYRLQSGSFISTKKMLLLK